MADQPREPHAAEILPFPRADWERNVNALQAKLDEAIVRTDHSPRTCHHDRSQVNERARTVTCRDCGVAMDPIDVLNEIARRREHLVYELRHLADERKRMRQQVDELRRDERNAKARVRAARKSALLIDEEAVTAAAAAVLDMPQIGAYAYRPWEALNPDQREVVVQYVARVIECYAGAMTGRDDWSLKGQNAGEESA